MTEPHKSSFVLISTAHGLMIVPRFDRQGDVGVGYTLLEQGVIDANDLTLLIRLLRARREHFGERVMVYDCGAYIGTHTITLANVMTSWGNVAAFEPQERIFYALAGAIAINNCFNAQPILAAIGGQVGTVSVPHLNFFLPANYGGMELRETEHNEPIGQAVDYHNAAPVRLVTIDSLNPPRLDLLKLDIEGMELEALKGAAETIKRSIPILFVEHVKSDVRALEEFFDSHGYDHIPMGMNTLAIHRDDPCHKLGQWPT